MIKLYYSPGACSLIVRIIINELGLSADYEAVNLKTKKTASNEDFYAINPKGSVPFLQLNEPAQALTENAVIIQYLADTENAIQLLPRLGDIERYHVLEWLNFMATEIHKSFGPLFNPAVPTALKTEVFIPILSKKFDYLNQHLETHPYLCGENFTLPDAYLFVLLRWTRGVNLDLNQWPHLSRYVATLKQRASVQKSLSEEGLAS